MTPDKFAALARVAYGFGWQSKIARDSNVHRATVLRWAAGKIPIPQAVKERVVSDAASSICKAVSAFIAA